jgi:hypothetical protein
LRAMARRKRRTRMGVAAARVESGRLLATGT